MHDARLTPSVQTIHYGCHFADLKQVFPNSCNDFPSISPPRHSNLVPAFCKCYQRQLAHLLYIVLAHSNLAWSIVCCVWCLCMCASTCCYNMWFSQLEIIKMLLSSLNQQAFQMLDCYFLTRVKQ